MSYQTYTAPVERANRELGDEVLEAYWDRKLHNLRAQDEAEYGLQRQLMRAGSDLNIWQMPDADRWWLLDMISYGRHTYPDAVRLFLEGAYQWTTA